MFHQNIQHLESRKESLEIILEDINPNIIILTEHNMKAYDLERFNLNNYVVTSMYSRTTTTGGGVVILSEKSLKSKPLNLSRIDVLNEDKLFECCVAKYSINKFSFLVVGMYRKPQLQNSEFLKRFDILMDILVSLKEQYKIIIAGDFNFDVLTFTNDVLMFKNILKSYGFQCLVDFPTRVTLTTSTAIDNIITNIDKSKFEVTGLVTALSDHDGQVAELNLPTKRETKRNYQFVECRDFSVQNMNTFLNILSKENWLPVFFANVEDKFKIFDNIFLYNFNLVFTLKKVKINVSKNKGNWINNDLILEEKEISDLIKYAKHTGNAELVNYCKLRNNDYKKRLVEAKKSFYNEQIRKSDNICKKTWEIINKETGKNGKNLHSSIHSINVDNDVISDPLNISNKFNNYFIRVIEELVQTAPEINNLLQNLQDNTRVNPISNPFRCQPVTEHEIEKIISSLKNKLSSGHDNIPLKLIKYVAKPLLKPLVHLINSSLITGIFPENLKMSKVVPIFKKGEKSELGSYRPVSLLPSISKIYERVMYNRLVKHLQNNNLFDTEQHGFRKGRSVITALIEFSESIIDSLDKGEKVAGIYMDLTKAFDSISHEILLMKLKILGISELCLNWIRSYLTDRTQYVEIKSIEGDKVMKYKSEILKIKHGVPQGSILGPLLFICYIQGMPLMLKKCNGTKSQLVLYADDSNLITSAKNFRDLEVACKKQIESIQTYFHENTLFLNLSKTKYMTFSTRQNNENTTFSISKEIEQINCTKFLGLTIDSNLSWDSHIKCITKKISSGLYILKRMSLFCELDTLKSIYFAHIHSHISYGLAVYGGTSKRNLDHILILQKKAIRIMLKLESDTSVKNCFSRLDILTVYDQYIFDCIVRVNDQLPNFILRSNIHSYNTRNRNQFDTSQHNLSFYTKKASHMGVKFLNHLPTTVKIHINNTSFKKILKEFLLKRSCYSLAEFLQTD